MAGDARIWALRTWSSTSPRPGTPGADPDALGLEQHGCHIAGSSWHAQLESGDEKAERLDVDRFKPRNLTIHRHPFGSSNDERVPAADVPAPEAWVNHVETISAEHYFS